MSNVRIWLVVPPAFGVSVFLRAVAAGSFGVHSAVFSNTFWVSDSLSGQELGAGDSAVLLRQVEAATAKASHILSEADGPQQVLIVMPDGTTRTAVMQAETLASATPAAPPSSY